MISRSVRAGGVFRNDHVRRGFLWLAPLLVIATFGLIAPDAAAASTYRWQFDASGSWTNAANWQVVTGPAGLGYPNLAGDVAVFDEPMAAARTITIPTGETITIGRLTITTSILNQEMTIARAGTGLLVFDNQGEDAIIESRQNAILSTPVQLAAHLIVDGGIEFAAAISETVPARNLTVSGHAVLTQTNTYTGTTTVISGQLVVLPDFPSVATCIQGPLVVGDGAGAAGSAEALVIGDSINHSADVQVNADGKVIFHWFVGSNSPLDFAIDGLTVAGGTVEIFMTGVTLTVQDLTMEGGTVFLNNSTNALRLAGSLTATSTAAGPAAIRSKTSLPEGSFILLPGNHQFTIADGPQAMDFVIQAPPISESAPGAGLSKLGPGVMQIFGSGSYTGGTTLAAGTLILVDHQLDSALTVSGGRLTGTGRVGALTATGGAIAPGQSPGTLLTGNLMLGAGSIYEVEIAGSGFDGYDRLGVTGTVNVTGATLAVTSTTILPPDHEFQIVTNDGSDPVQGTFAGLPEGAIITTASGARFVISYHGIDGNDIVLTNITPVTYYLSEGATGSFFDEDILIANPNADPAPVTLTFLLPGGGTHVEQRTVPAFSRLTIDVNEIQGLEATSPSVVVASDNRLPLAVERTMMWDKTHYAGHTANAVTRPERTWYFAEGAQGSFFQTYLLLANPNSSQVQATVTFLRENAAPAVETFQLAPQSRQTIYAGDYAALADRNFGMKVEALQPITAERAMYFASTPGRQWNGGTGNAGVAEPSTSWYHPEGASGAFFTTFILLSNPQDVPAAVNLRFLTAFGQSFDLAKTIGPQQRISVNPAAEGIPGLTDAAFATVVSSNVPVVSERAMYWPGEPGLPIGEGHASSGLTGTARRWALAEGRVGGPEAFTTYILIANPETAGSAFVQVRFLRENGRPAVVKEYNISAGVRFNLDVGTMVPELQDESFGTRIEVMTGSAIAVERSLYWNANGVFWAGGTNALGSRLP